MQEGCSTILLPHSPSPLPFLSSEEKGPSPSLSHPSAWPQDSVWLGSRSFFATLILDPFQLPPLSALWFFIKGCLETQIKGGAHSQAPSLAWNRSDMLQRLARAGPALPAAWPPQAAANSLRLSACSRVNGVHGGATQAPALVPKNSTSL